MLEKWFLHRTLSHLLISNFCILTTYKVLGGNPERCNNKPNTDCSKKKRTTIEWDIIFFKKRVCHASKKLKWEIYPIEMCSLYSGLGMIHVGSKEWTKAKRSTWATKFIGLIQPLYMTEHHRKMKIRALHVERRNRIRRQIYHLLDINFKNYSSL